MKDRSSGLRKTTAETLTAQAHARRYRGEGVQRISRSAALRVAKLAAAAMGLKSAKIALIDQLFACSKSQDWDAIAASPVVWPSNARLARSLGICVSTMKHHLNGLVRAGLVAYSDGPTYQRRGLRDASGNIVEGHGIDLSPIAVRFRELTEMVEAADYEAREWKRYSYRRTVLRKEVQSLILSALHSQLSGPWQHAQARLDVIREGRPQDLDELRAQVAALQEMQEQLEEAYTEATDDLNVKSAVSKFRPLLTTAEPSISELSKEQRTRAIARESKYQVAFGEMAFEKKPPAAAGPWQPENEPKPTLDDDVRFISLPLVRDACPKLVDLVPGAFDSWSALRESGRDLCVSAGINPQVWQEAQSVLGTDIAVAAVAVTVQKADAGLVAKPGAYLRTLVQRGRDGELHISKSLFALAKGVESERATRSRPIPQDAEAFPTSGSIRYGRWSDVIRDNTPQPTPDLDMVADAFRRWARARNIDLTSPNVERVLIAFCSKWKSQ